jgi:hypothetical protein
LVANCVPEVTSGIFGGSARKVVGSNNPVDHVGQHGSQRPGV